MQEEISTSQGQVERVNVKKGKRQMFTTLSSDETWLKAAERE